MKNALKSAFAVLAITAMAAACTPKTETTTEQDTVKVDTTEVAATPIDTAAAPADSTVVAQ